MDKSLLNHFRMTIAEKRLGAYGIHVYKKGEGSVAHRFRSDDPVCLYSASKTFTAVAVGICQDEGKIRLSDALISYFPEYEAVASPGTEDITLRDLLHMSCGKDIDWFSGEEEPYKDYAESFFKEPMKRKPGEKFFYCNPCTYMLSRIVEKASGEIMRDYLMPRLFIPFGIPNPQWQTCPQGHTIGATGLFLRTEELAKIGQLLLQEGEYEGKQLVSKEYVKAMYEDVVSTAHWDFDLENVHGYGYQVWLCRIPGTYRADGMYGQYSVVMPHKNAVVTATSHEERIPNDILRAIFNDIEPLL